MSRPDCKGPDWELTRLQAITASNSRGLGARPWCRCGRKGGAENPRARCRISAVLALNHKNGAGDSIGRPSGSARPEEGLFLRLSSCWVRDGGANVAVTTVKVRVLGAQSFEGTHIKKAGFVTGHVLDMLL